MPFCETVQTELDKVPWEIVWRVDLHEMLTVMHYQTFCEICTCTCWFWCDCKNKLVMLADISTYSVLNNSALLLRCASWRRSQKSSSQKNNRIRSKLCSWNGQGGCSEIDKQKQVLLQRCVLYGSDCVFSGVCVSLVCVYVTCVWCVVCD